MLGILGKATEQDLRTLDLKLIIRVYEIMLGFCGIPSGGENGAVSSTVSVRTVDSVPTGRESALAEVMGLGVRLLRSPNIKHKLLGMSVLVRMKGRQAGDCMYWTELSEYAKRLHDSGFVEAVFGESAHEEIIRKAPEMLLFLIKEKEFSGSDLALVWRCCVEKHEDVTRRAFEVLAGLLPEFYETVFCM